MVFKLNRTGSVLNRNERLSFNENWDRIEKVIKDRGLEILSESGFLTWLDKNGIKHREEVATFSDLPSNDSLNTVRGVLGDNKIYIKKESGWVPFQSIDINKINDVENEIKTELSQIAINPRRFGARFDGGDDTQAVKNALEEASKKGNNEVLLSGVVGLSETLEIPQGVTLNSYNATIKPLVNINVISFNRNTKIKGTLRIKAKDHRYTSSMLHFDGSKRLSYRDISIDKIFLEGHHAEGMGNAIHFECTEDVSDISFVQFGEVVIRGFEKGVFFDAPYDESSEGARYINANMFDKLIISDCDYYIYGTGDHGNRNDVDGNTLPNVQLQYNARVKEMIHLEGRHNVINAFIWDTNNKNAKAVNLTQTSRNNEIYIAGLSDLTKIKDFGNDNYVSLIDEFYHKVPTSLNSRQNKRLWEDRYEGEYQDLLHNADKLQATNVVTGNSLIDSGSLSNVFDGLSNSSLELDIQNEYSFIFEIDFSNARYQGSSQNYLSGGLKNLGFVFDGTQKPKEIIVETTSSSGIVNSSNIVIDHDTNLHDRFHLISGNSQNGLRGNIQKIRVTLKSQIGEKIRLNRIFGNGASVGGNRYISNSGGFVGGDLDFVNDSSIRLGTRPTVPSAHPFHHRRVIIISSPGYDERVMTCIKKADGTYEWVQLN